MESKFTPKALKVYNGFVKFYNSPITKFTFLGTLSIMAFLLFIGEDPLNKKLYPNMAIVREEWNKAYVLEQNLQALGTFFYSCVCLGLTSLLFEYFPNKSYKIIKVFYFIFVFAAVFRAVSFCDILDRSQGDYEFKGTVDKLIMLGSLILAMNQYYKIKDGGLQKTS